MNEGIENPCVVENFSDQAILDQTLRRNDLVRLQVAKISADFLQALQ